MSNSDIALADRLTDRELHGNAAFADGQCATAGAHVNFVVTDPATSQLITWPLRMGAAETRQATNSGAGHFRPGDGRRRHHQGIRNRP
jgi:hypothetical protein